MIKNEGYNRIQETSIVTTEIEKKESEMRLSHNHITKDFGQDQNREVI